MKQVPDSLLAFQHMVMRRLAETLLRLSRVP